MWPCLTSFSPKNSATRNWRICSARRPCRTIRRSTRKHAKALSELEPLVERFREFKAVVHDIAGAEELVAAGDADMRELAKEELKALTVKRDALVGELKILLIPKDPNDAKNVVLEIRAGTGGDEAALFAR